MNIDDINQISFPSSKRTKDYLKQLHPLPVFDDNVYQEPKEHVYFVRDPTTDEFRRFKGSCTGALGEHFPKFDREKAYAAMVRKGVKTGPGGPYHGLTKQEIFDNWADAGDEGAEFGSAMHAAIELACNGATDFTEPIWQSPENSPSLYRYMQWDEDYILQPGEVFGQALDPEKKPKGRYYRTELTMFDADFEFAGQADVLIERPGGVFTLGDWKRTKKDLLKEDIFDHGLRMFAGLPNTARVKYSIQAWLYALCIMKFCPSIRIDDLRIGVFHPNNPTYVWIPALDYREEAQAMLNWRRAYYGRLNTSRLLATLPRLSTLLINLAEIMPEYAVVSDETREALEAARSLDRLLHYNAPEPASL